MVQAVRFVSQSALWGMFTRVLVEALCSGEGNYRCDMQGRVQHVRRATGAPDDLPRLQKQLFMRDFDILAPG